MFFCVIALVVGPVVGLPHMNKDRSPATESVRAYPGDLTWFNPAIGACGQNNGDNDPVVAISHLIFDEGATPDPNNNPHCNKRIKAWHNGNIIHVGVVDQCTDCTRYDIDVSPAMFKKLADSNAGLCK